MFRIFKNFCFCLTYILFIYNNATASDNIFKKTNIELLDSEVLNQKNEPIVFTKILKNNSNYLINFWATWCQPCKKELPDLERIQNNLKDIGLKIYIISIDKKNIKDQQLFLKNLNIKELTQFFDPNMNFFNSLNLRGIPTSILIKNNTIIGKKEGIIKYNVDLKKELKNYFK